MRDVILAAAGEAADTTSMPARESGHAEPRDDMTAQLTQARSAGETEGVKQGSTSERARIKAIITSDQAKGREELAP